MEFVFAALANTLAALFLVSYVGLLWCEWDRRDPPKWVMWGLVVGTTGLIILIATALHLR